MKLTDIKRVLGINDTEDAVSFANNESRERSANENVPGVVPSARSSEGVQAGPVEASAIRQSAPSEGDDYDGVGGAREPVRETALERQRDGRGHFAQADRTSDNHALSGMSEFDLRAAFYDLMADYLESEGKPRDDCVADDWLEAWRKKTNRG